MGECEFSCGANVSNPVDILAIGKCDANDSFGTQDCDWRVVGAAGLSAVVLDDRPDGRDAGNWHDESIDLLCTLWYWKRHDSIVAGRPVP